MAPSLSRINNAYKKIYLEFRIQQPFLSIKMNYQLVLDNDTLNDAGSDIDSLRID